MQFRGVNSICSGELLRDLAMFGRKGFASDIDLVVDGDWVHLANYLERLGASRNRFGGYRLYVERWPIDIWAARETWAIREGLVRYRGIESLTKTTILNWDAILLNWRTKEVVCGPDYFSEIQQHLMDVVLTKNPNPLGAAVRAFRHLCSKDAEKLTVAAARYLGDAAKRHSSESIVRAETASYRNRGDRSDSAWIFRTVGHELGSCNALPIQEGYAAPIQGDFEFITATADLKRQFNEMKGNRPVIDAAVEDLDGLRLRRYFRCRFPDWTPPDDWRETLTAHKLAVEVENRVLPTCVGVLLFAEQPERFLPGAYVDLLLYKHEEADGNAADRKRFLGPVPEQIEQAVSWLRASPLNPVVSVKDGGGRHDFPAYDDRALQEAVVNALVHRDYEVRGSQVIINMFADRIVFQNPGSLYNHLSPEMLYAGCQPGAPQPDSCRIPPALRQSGDRRRLHGGDWRGVPQPGARQRAAVRPEALAGGYRHRDEAHHLRRSAGASPVSGRSAARRLIRVGVPVEGGVDRLGAREERSPRPHLHLARLAGPPPTRGQSRGAARDAARRPPGATAARTCCGELVAASSRRRASAARRKRRAAAVLHWGRESSPDLTRLRDEIRDAFGGRAPRVLDPFAGGGAIPLEAMRLGCEVTASDLNPRGVVHPAVHPALPTPDGRADPSSPGLRPAGPALSWNRSSRRRGSRGKSDLRSHLARLGHDDGLSAQPNLLRRRSAGTKCGLSLALRAPGGSRVLAGARRELASYYPTYAELEPLKRKGRRGKSVLPPKRFKRRPRKFLATG